MRAKAKIRDANIPYEVPGPAELPQRLDSVLRVIYLVFNEGYSASAGDALTRHDLSAQAVRIARLLAELLPEQEVLGLLALILPHDSRCAARATAGGDLILLEARDLNEALALAGKIPPARYGSVEVRPVRELVPEGNTL